MSSSPHRSVEADLIRRDILRSLFGKDPAPAKIGRFAVLEKVGEGGMGRVFSAYDPNLKREVAVKLLRSETAAAEDSNGRARLLREAQAMARLSHPNVLPVFEVGEHEGDVFVAMELVRGATLRAWAEGRSIDEILEMYGQAGRGLGSAHAADLVHRDFKPENVLVGEDGRPRVMDFGLARPMDEAWPSAVVPSEPNDDTDTPMTRTGTVLGTPAYMAPEQLLGQPTDARSDQFSFAVALWEALFGARPFTGDSIATLRRAVETGEPSKPRDAPKIAARTETALRRALSVDPADRFESMEALVDALAVSSGRRLRILAVAALLAGAGVTAAAVSKDDPPETDPCVDARRGLDGVWDDDIRADVDARLRSIDQPHADNIAAFVRGTLDDYAASWLDTNDAVCRAIEADPGSERAASQRRCLEARRLAVDVGLELLVEEEPQLLDMMRNVVVELPPISECSDDRVLRAESRVLSEPRDPKTHAEARRAVAVLRARIASELKSFEEGENTVALAKASGDRALEAEALFLYGTILHSRSTGEEAVVVLDEALLAAEESGHDRIAARAAASAAFSLRMKQDEAQRRLPRVRALVERTHDPEATFRLMHTEAQILRASGAAREAMDEWRRTLAYIEENLHPRHRFIGYVRMQLWMTARDLGAYEEMAGYFKEVLAETLEFHPPGTWRVCLTAIRAAGAMAQAGLDDQARELLRHCGTRLQQAGELPVRVPADDVNGIWVDEVAADLVRLRAIEPQAMPMVRRMLAVAPQALDDNASWDLWSLYTALFDAGEYELVLQSLDKWETARSYRTNIPLNAFRARTYQAMGDCASAEELLRKVERRGWDELPILVLCAAVRFDPRTTELLDTLAEQAREHEWGRHDRELRLGLIRLEALSLLGRHADVLAEAPTALAPLRERVDREGRYLLHVGQGLRGRAKLALGDAEGALEDLTALGADEAQADRDQGIRFDYAKALVATGGSRAEALRVAQRVKARWAELGPHNEAKVAAVDAWLALHDPAAATP